jgi:hypothetical protein
MSMSTKSGRVMIRDNSSAAASRVLPASASRCLPCDIILVTIPPAPPSSPPLSIVENANGIRPNIVDYQKKKKKKKKKGGEEKREKKTCIN